jgi:hypothetical protein
MQEDYLLAKAKSGMKAEFERQKSLTKVKLVATKYSTNTNKYNSLIVMVQSYGEKVEICWNKPKSGFG